ncbi:MAG: type II secretion system F family protein [Candidatus Omnitrophica bacterium]|nr:type II secretion system F family protein [Candidatus Omnitrophota bacterium]
MIILLPYIVFALAFSCIFIVVSQFFFYRESQQFIQERFIPDEAEQRSKKYFILKPVLKPLAPINEHIGSQILRAKVKHQLFIAGSPLNVNEYFLFRELFVVFVPLMVGLLFGWDKLTGNSLIMAMCILFSLFVPQVWLRSRVERRKREVLRALPNMIDLLILAVDAGLDFMIAVRKVIQRAKAGPMVDELFQLWQEVQMGRVRRDALKNMAKRWNIPEINSFVRTLVQAERMGTPMGEALRTLSEEIRIRQFQRGEQQALKAPIKMLFPLLVFILPVVIILVGGPVFIQFSQSGLNLFK